MKIIVSLTMARLELPTITPTKYISTLFATFLFVHHSLKPLVLLPLFVGLDILIFWKIFVSNIGIFVNHNTFLFRIHFCKLLRPCAKSVEMPRVVITPVEHSVSPRAPEAALEGVSLSVVLVGFL